MNLLNFKEFLLPGNAGIPKDKFDSLETANDDFDAQLLREFPFLRFYKGFAINLFKIILNKTTVTYHIRPIKLSKRWRENHYLNIDLLVLSDTVKAQFSSSSSPHHVVTILNFPGLVRTFHKNVHKKNVQNLIYACRGCSMMLSSKEYRSHVEGCFNSDTIKATANRSIKNFVIHQPKVLCKQTNKLMTRTIKFKASSFYKTLQPLLIGAADFESNNKEITVKSAQVPNNAIFSQKAIGFSMGFISLYDNIELPPKLRDIYVQFYDERSNTLQDLYLAFLLKLRESLLDSYNFLREVLSKDQGAPDLKDIPLHDRLMHIFAQRCDFCGSTFGKKYGKFS